MRLAVVGSRSVANKFLVYECIEEYLQALNMPCEEIVSGGALGVDSYAAAFAEENEIPLQVYLPNWKKFGKAAGYKRNGDIVGRATHVLAIHDGVSKGTEHLIELAKKKNKQLSVVFVEHEKKHEK